MSGDNIKVAVRIRPLIKSERSAQIKEQWGVQNTTIYQIDDKGQRLGDSCFTFDHIFEGDKNNTEIYNNVVKEFVDAFLGGVNSTIFAYGQTSSGKTYTMLGTDSDPGVMTQSIENVFDFIKANIDRKYLIRVSYLEIYNEKIGDLLQPSNVELKIREDYNGTIILQNAKEEIVSSREQVYEYLKIGNNNRRIGATNMNEKSSRSHTIFKIMIESTESDDTENRNVVISCLSLVDLAGSERVANTKASGKRLIEGGHINKSLTTLGMVIRRLSENHEFINFRDSKLTRLLQHSLGGNSKTLIIAAVTPASIDFTQSTLLFAQTAKAVKNKPEINEVLSHSAVIKRYETLNQEYKSRLDELLNYNKNLEHDKERNSKVIARLSEQIHMLELFQSGIEVNKGTPKSEKEKRRHTIGYICKKEPLLKTITEEESTNFSLANGTQDGACNMLTEDAQSPYTPPKSVIKVRLEELKKDYDELVSYTRLEKDVVNEDNNEELKEKLAVTTKELSDFKVKHEEEVTRLQDKYQNGLQEISQLKIQMTSEAEILRTQLADKYKRREQELLNRIENLQREAPRFSNNYVEEIKEKIADDLYSLQELLINIPDNAVESDDSALPKTDNRTCDDCLKRQSSDSLSQKLTNLVRENDDLTQAISKMREQSAVDKEVYSKTLQEHSSHIKELQSENAVLSERVATIDREKEILYEEMSQLHEDHLKENDAYSKEIVRYVSQIDKLSLEKVELSRSVQNLEAENNLRGCKLENYKDKLASLNKEHANVCDLNKKLQEHYAQKEIEVRSYAKAVEDLELEQAEILVQQISSLEKENEILNRRLNEFEKKEQKYLDENSNLMHEYKQVTDEFSKLRDCLGDKNQYLADCLSRIERLNGEKDKLLPLVEKNSNLFNENRTLSVRISDLTQQHAQKCAELNSELENCSRVITSLENEKEALKSQISQLQTDETNEILLQENKKFRNRIAELEGDYARKTDELSNCLAQIDQLNSAREKALILEETNLNSRNENQALNLRISDLQQELTDKTEAFRKEKENVFRDMQSLRTKISNIQKDNDILNRRILEEKEAKCNVVDSLQRKIASLQSERKSLNQSITDITRSGNLESDDQINMLKARVRDLTLELNNTRLTADVHESQVITANSSMEQEKLNHTKITEELELNIKKLKSKIEATENTLKISLDMWIEILAWIVKEQKIIYTMKISQEQRPHMKEIRNELRDSNLQVKILNASINKEDYSNFANLGNAIIRAWDIMKRYFEKDRIYQSDKMRQLDEANQEQLQEITKLHSEKQYHVLKDHSGNIENLAKTECTKCPQMKEECTKAKEALQKEIRTIVDLREKLYELQDEHETCQTKISEIQDECHFQREQLDRLKKKTETSQTGVQCELLSETELCKLRDKYQTVKNIAVMRREEIEKLKKQLAEKH